MYSFPTEIFFFFQILLIPADSSHVLLEGSYISGWCNFDAKARYFPTGFLFHFFFPLPPFFFTTFNSRIKQSSRLFFFNFSSPWIDESHILLCVSRKFELEGWSDAWEGFYSLSREYTWSFVFNGNFSFSLSFSPNFFPQLSRNSFPPLFSSRCTFHFFGKCQVNNTRRKWMKNWKNGIYFYFPALKLKDPIRNVLFFCNWWVNFLPKYLSYKFFFFTVSREER